VDILPIGMAGAGKANKNKNKNKRSPSTRGEGQFAYHGYKVQKLFALVLLVAAIIFWIDSLSHSTGGSTGEDENNENSLPPTNIKPSTLSAEPEEKVVITTSSSKQGRSDSDLDADDEANNSGDVKTNRDEMGNLRGEIERLMQLVGAKEKRIVALELQVAQLTRQISEIRDENSKLLQVISQTTQSSAKKSP